MQADHLQCFRTNRSLQALKDVDLTLLATEAGVLMPTLGEYLDIAPSRFLSVKPRVLRWSGVSTLQHNGLEPSSAGWRIGGITELDARQV